MSTIDSKSVHVTRRIAASPERVFEAWVSAALLTQWLAPKAEADARPGGHFRLEVSTPEAVHVVSGEYREFVPGVRLVATWDYDGPMSPDGKMEALLTVELRGDGAGTEVAVHHEHLTSPTYRDAIKSGAWTKALDKLEVLLGQ